MVDWYSRWFADWRAVPSANSRHAANSPAWPEEETGSSASGWGEETLRTERPKRSERNEGYRNDNFSVPSDNNGFDSRPPLTRRIGRDPVPSREQREPREFRGPREPRGNDSNRGAPRRSRNLDDLSTLNLPVSIWARCLKPPHVCPSQQGTTTWTSRGSSWTTWRTSWVPFVWT